MRAGGLAAALIAVCLAAVGCGRTAPPSASSSASPSPSAARSASSSASPPPSAASSASASASAQPALPHFSHVFLVVMENLSYSAALKVPQLAALAGRYAVATRYYAAGHPSLPNYLALASGSTWGVSSDCLACYQSHPNLGAQLSSAGVSWGAYMEGLPAPCSLAPYALQTRYAGKHDPFRYFTDIRASASLCAHIQPLRGLAGLLGGPAAAVPRFVWVTPNLCHDGHDCPATTAASWLTGFVAQVTASAAWRRGGVLLVTWDEAEGGDDTGVSPTGAVTPRGGGGHVLTLVIAPGLPAGLRVATPYSHYSLLRTVETTFGLPLLAHAADPGTADLRAFWSRSPSPPPPAPSPGTG